MRKIFLLTLLLLTFSSSVFANMNIVATLPWIGSLAKEIGKNNVSVTVLVKPNQDAHMIEAKPSMILAARKANIIMYNGLDLEIGYLPLIIESSKNPALMPGKIGNFDCSQFVAVLEKPTTVDRSLGDVHPLGNPHYHLSPSNIIKVAEGMARLLGEMDSDHAKFYAENFRRFAGQVKEKQKHWHTIPLKGKNFIAYHKYFEYLAQESGFKISNYLEPKPGLPPSARHIEELIQGMKKTKADGILVTPAYGMDEANSLSRKTGVKVIILPHDVGSLPGVDDLVSFWNKVIAELK